MTDHLAHRLTWLEKCREKKTGDLEFRRDLVKPPTKQEEEEAAGFEPIDPEFPF